MQNCYECKIYDNIFNNCSILMYGEEIKYYIHEIENNSIIENNILHPIYYYKNMNNLNISDNCRSTILVNCFNISIEMNTDHVNIGAHVINSTNIFFRNDNRLNFCFGKFTSLLHRKYRGNLNSLMFETLSLYPLI